MIISAIYMQNRNANPNPNTNPNPNLNPNLNADLDPNLNPDAQIPTTARPASLLVALLVLAIYMHGPSTDKMVRVPINPCMPCYKSSQV